MNSTALGLCLALTFSLSGLSYSAVPVGSYPGGMSYTFGNDADEKQAPLFKKLGATSIESYVTWETCESKALGQWDWSKWDKQVEVLKANDLKWVPFVILGPAYSLPKWYRESADYHPCRCLEHGIDSKIESLWNPNLPKWIERFVAEFAKRYRDSGVIESVLLGIQGDYGEAIYSATQGKDWTFDLPGEYHRHPGYWCNDPYALADFRKYARKKYGEIGALNKAWKASYGSFDEIVFPKPKEEISHYSELNKWPNWVSVRNWLDFVDWYRQSMTRWSDWWIATTRKYFPDTPIYLCTGGEGQPWHGSQFADQCRVAAKHKAAIRITNEASNFAQNYYLTRLLATAGKFYGAPFGFEPAGQENEEGIIARIFNATTSGASQLHDYNDNLIRSASRAQAQQSHIKYLFHVPKPIVPVAVWYPNTDLALHWSGFAHALMELRDYTDADIIDESLLRAGALDRYKVLVVIHGDVMEAQDSHLISQWMRRGGRLIVKDVKAFRTPDGSPASEQFIFGGSPNGRKLGDGSVARVSLWRGLAAALTRTLVELGLPAVDMRKDGVFACQISEDSVMALNTCAVEKCLRVSDKQGHVDYKVAAGTITRLHISCPASSGGATCQ